MRWMLVLVLVGCAGNDDVIDTDPAETDTEVGPACATMNGGEDWAWRGECPQMRTPCEIEVDGCDVSIAYSSGMTMGMPSGGVIADDVITFSGGSVTGCVGTLEDPDTISGSCADGCTFTLDR